MLLLGQPVDPLGVPFNGTDLVLEEKGVLVVETGGKLGPLGVGLCDNGYTISENFLK